MTILATKGESFFNTTRLEGEDLKKAVDKAVSQEEKILNYFKLLKTRELTASEVWRSVFDVDSTPLTSIRRAMTVLMSKGLLKKTDKQIEGMYGALEHKWKLK